MEKPSVFDKIIVLPPVDNHYMDFKFNTQRDSTKSPKQSIELGLGISDQIIVPD
jgi:hypothetical protein